MIIKLLLKVIALILFIPVVLIRWVAIFLNNISSVIFGILSGIFTLTALAGFAFGICSGKEAIQIFIIAFVAVVIPYIGEWVIKKNIMIQYFLEKFIYS